MITWVTELKVELTICVKLHSFIKILYLAYSHVVDYNWSLELAIKSFKLNVISAICQNSDSFLFKLLDTVRIETKITILSKHTHEQRE